MMTMDEIKKLASTGRFKRIPMSLELYADQITPVRLLRLLKHRNKRCCLLENRENLGMWEQYTYVGYDPIAELTVKDGQAELTRWEIKRKRTRRSSKGEKGKSQDWDGRAEAADGNSGDSIEPDRDDLYMEEPAEVIEKVTLEEEHPREILRRLLKECRSPKVEDLPPFTGGIAGWVSGGWEMYDFLLFDKAAVFDHFRRKLILIVNVDAAKLDTDYFRGQQELRRLERLIREGGELYEEGLQLTSGFQLRLTQEESRVAAEKGRERIRRGESLPMVLCNPLEAKMEGSLLDGYRALRADAWSPYLFYLSGSRSEAAGSSDGPFVQLGNGDLSAVIYSGEQSRGTSKKEDGKLERALLADEKERADHNLFADLGRNNLGKVCRFGSMRTERYRSVERGPYRMQISSVFTGKLQRGMDGLDVLDAFLPSVILLDGTGNLDLCGLDHFMSGRPGKVTVHSQTRITADSVPDKAYEACLYQADDLLQALEAAEEGEEL